MTRGPITPIIIGSQALPLERIRLGQGVHNEEWLQSLLDKHPTLLPIAHIEPAFGRLVSVGREVACGHGYIDNVFVTPVGEIVIVETKLWSNPQARREVVAQALDYAAALSRMTYEQFETVVLRAPCNRHGKISSLHAMIADQPDALDEAAFVDAMAMNLKRGRMLVIAAGDGIRQEAETLASLLQGHAGAHFTFAMVELAAYKLGDEGNYLVVPSTLIRTVMVERGIVTLDQGQIVMRPPTAAIVPAGATPTPKSITEASFLELMAARDPALPAAIQAFVKSVEPMGVYAEFAASLNLKVDWDGAARAVGLGYIQKNGRLQTGNVGWFAPVAPTVQYVSALAAMIGGSVASANNYYQSRATIDGKTLPLIEQLLPAHSVGWRVAIENFLAELRRSVASD